MKKGVRKALLAVHQARVRQGLGNRTGFPTSKGAVTERFFREQAALADWGVSKRGWPDFILQRDGQIIFVEAKSEPRNAAQTGAASYC